MIQLFYYFFLPHNVKNIYKVCLKYHKKMFKVELLTGKVATP